MVSCLRFSTFLIFSATALPSFSVNDTPVFNAFSESVCGTAAGSSGLATN